MKVGELVRIRDYTNIQNPNRQRYGMIVKIDNSHRQTVADVLFHSRIRKRIWSGHLEAISESR